MAASFINSALFQSATGQTTYSPTYNLQTAQGNNRLVCVGISVEDSGTDDVQSVTIGGQAPAGSLQVTGGSGYSCTAYLGWWFDDDLPVNAGNTTIAVTMTGSITRDIKVSVTEHTDINQTATVRTGQDSSASAGSASTSVTVDADDSVGIGVFSCGGTTYGSPTNLTQRQALGAESSAGGIGTNENVDGSSITLGWASMSTRYGFVAAVFQWEAASSSSSSSTSSSSSSSSSESSSSSSWSVVSASYVPKYWETQEEGNESFGYIDVEDVPLVDQTAFFTWLVGSPSVPNSNTNFTLRYFYSQYDLDEIAQTTISKYLCTEENWMNWYRWYIYGGNEPTPIPFCNPPDPPWYDTDWSYRKPITIDSTKVESTESNFVVYLDIEDSDLAADARSDGYDILFTSDDGVTKIYHERTLYADSTGELKAFINLPEIDSTTDTVFYMYYGNIDSTDQQNIDLTWPTQFKGVWHLDELLSGTGTYEDSSGNDNDGTNNGVNWANGRIFRGGQFNGGDYVTVGNPTELNISGDITVMAWVRVEGGQGAHRPIAGKGDTQYMLRAGLENHLQFFVYNGSTYANARENGSYSLNTWYRVVGRLSGTEVALFLDGVKQNDTPTGGLTTSSQNFEIGRNSQQTSRTFNGKIDEVYVVDDDLSDGWIKTEFNNQNDPSTFCSVGSVEEPC